MTLNVALTCLLALIALAVAVSGTHSVIGLVYHLAGLAIATPVLTLIGLPTLYARLYTVCSSIGNSDGTA